MYTNVAQEDSQERHIHALYGMDQLLKQKGFDIDTYYKEVRQLMNTVNSQGDNSFCAHMDGGSMVCTTDKLCLILWEYEELPVAPVRLQVADRRAHYPSCDNCLTRCYHQGRTV